MAYLDIHTNILSSNRFPIRDQLTLATETVIK
jgi:hypothetical protein